MTAAAALRAGRAASNPATAAWMLIAVHAAILLVPPVITGFGISGEPATGPPLVALALGLGVLALQLHHSLALARGRRPRGAPWTMAALALLVYLPLPWFGWSWVWMQAAVLASLPMVLGGWPLAVALAAPVLATDLAAVRLLAGRQPAVTVVFWVLYQTFTLVALPAALWGSARLARVLAELQATRAELAALAVGRERLRISRDLHDLLGQSLSAISLKGDLAMRLLGRDPAAARDEIEGLSGVARQALAGVRAVTRDQPAVGLAGELDGAAGLLAAAGIQAHLELDLPQLPRPTEEVLAWAVREGVTNVLRHSQASHCWITATRVDGRVRLVIENDGVPAPVGEGSGLEGLAERAGALSGSVAAGVTPDGRFRLLVQVPEHEASR
jgi:two-component system, NarL family, sensor histidine kinase DesK